MDLESGDRDAGAEAVPQLVEAADGHQAALVLMNALGVGHVRLRR